MQKIFSWLVAACGVSSIFMVSFVCYTYWPDQDSSLPSWVQAVGSILAILAAGVGLAWQANKQDQQEQSRRNHELLGMLQALDTETKSYGKMLSVLELHFSHHNALLLTDRLQLVLPPIEPVFAIYQASAPLIGKISNPGLRDDIVSFYAEMVAFFAALNRNSSHAALIPHDGVPTGDNADALAQMGPALVAQLEGLIKAADRLSASLPAAIEAVAASHR